MFSLDHSELYDSVDEEKKSSVPLRTLHTVTCELNEHRKNVHWADASRHFFHKEFNYPAE